MAEVQDTLAEANSALTKWEDKMAAHNTLGSAAKDPKHVDKIKVRKFMIGKYAFNIQLSKKLQLTQKIAN